MKTLKTYRALPEAFLDKTRLEDAGISTFLAGEDTGSIGYGGTFNEIQLQVREEDLESARNILDSKPQPLPDDADTGQSPNE